MTITTPYIHKHDDGEVYIIGEPQALEALGTLLILKAKLGRNLVANFYDGVNPMIRIETDDEINKRFIE